MKDNLERKYRTVTLTLPFPPSVNRMWRSVNGKMLLSREARVYLAQVAFTIRSEKFEKDVRLEADITVHAKDNRRRDLDNLMKITLDSLEKSEVFENDSQFDKLTISRGEVDPQDPRVVINIQERVI